MANNNSDEDLDDDDLYFFHGMHPQNRIVRQPEGADGGPQNNARVFRAGPVNQPDRTLANDPEFRRLYRDDMRNRGQRRDEANLREMMRLPNANVARQPQRRVAEPRNVQRLPRQPMMMMQLNNRQNQLENPLDEEADEDPLDEEGERIPRLRRGGNQRFGRMAAGQEPQGEIRNRNNNRLLRAQTWVVTLRGAVAPRDHTGQQAAPNGAVLDYQCGQIELGLNPGYGQQGYHWQGYLEFSLPVTAMDIINLFGWIPGRVHLETRKGTQQQAIDYTKKEDTKEGDWEEYGTAHPPDVINANEQIREAILDGAQLEYFIGNQNLWGTALRQHKGIERFIELVSAADPNAKKLRKIKVVVYYGDSRSGKSGTVWRRYENNIDDVYKKPREASLHFTGYKKQPVLLLEEFGQHDVGLPPQMVQELLDPYPMKLKVMYGQAQAHWDTVYICSNIPPDQWYPNSTPAVRTAIQKRISEVWRFTQDAIYLEKGPGEFPPIPDPEIQPPPSIVTRPGVVLPTPCQQHPMPAADVLKPSNDKLSNILLSLLGKNNTHDLAAKLLSDTV